MSKLFEVKLDDSSEVQILIAPTRELGGAETWSVGDDVIERSTATLSGALDMVRAIGQSAIKKLGDLDVASTEATVGLKLTGKGKFVVAEAGAEATLSVKFIIRKAQ